MPVTLPCNIKKRTMVKEILIYTARGQLEGSWIAGILFLSIVLPFCRSALRYQNIVSRYPSHACYPAQQYQGRNERW